MLQLLRLGEECPVEWEQGMQYLQGWVSSVLSLLTQRPSSFRLAAQLVDAVEQFKFDVESPATYEMLAFVKILYETAVAAELAVNAVTGKATAMWGEKELEMFLRRKDEDARKRVEIEFPEMAGQ